MNGFGDGRRDPARRSIPRGGSPRKSAAARKHGRQAPVGEAGCVFDAARGEFLLWLKDFRTGKSCRAFVTPHQAAGLAHLICEELDELKGLRDAAVPGSGVPS
jgi:hypothetical protein